MKLIETTAFAALVFASLAAHAELPLINISVGGEISPGVYGQVQLGNLPPPPLVFPQPTIIERRSAAVGTPLYLHVPPGHAMKWDKHCHKYNACDRSVYFIKSSEYEADERGYKKDKGRKHGNEDRGDKGNRGRGRGD